MPSTAASPCPALEEEPRALAVLELTLRAFRSYREARLTVDRSPVVLTGPNGSGKTNLLEAISLLAPGRGLRRAGGGDLQCRTSAEPWAVAAHVETSAGIVALGTGRDPEGSPTGRRVLRVDGRPVSSQQALGEHVAVAWITPTMDRLLAEGPGARRKLLDRLAASFDPAHGGRVQRYERALRERLRLLRDGVADTTWLGALENDLAQTGVAIAAARRHLVRQLQAVMPETTSAFPQAELALEGLAEEALDRTPALVVEDHFREALASARREDAAQGLSSIGPHRSDLRVTHPVHACLAAHCSTGEQKALLVAIVLAYTRVVTRTRGLAPLVLLDDIAAHLDSLRRAALFEELTSLGVQAWLTGTDPEVFAPFVAAGAQPWTVDSRGLMADTLYR